MSFGGVIFAAAAQDASIASAWENASYEVSRGKRTRVGHAADLCGYLGSGTPTLSAELSTHFQWMGVPNLRIGLAPKNGAGAFGTAWVASPADSYVGTLTDPTTGDPCTVTINTSGTFEVEGLTFDNANTADIGSILELKNTYASQLRGTVFCFVPGEYDPTTYNAGSTDMRFSVQAGSFTGVWDGYTIVGGNWTTITARGGRASVKVNMIAPRTGDYGLDILGLTLAPTSGSTAPAGVRSVENTRYVRIRNNDIDTSGQTSGDAHGAWLTGAAARYVVFENNRHVAGGAGATEYTFRGGCFDSRITGLFTTDTTGDFIQWSIPTGALNQNMIIEDCFYVNILYVSPDIHGDIGQFEIANADGSYLEGSAIFRRIAFVNGSDGTARGNFIFGKGSSGTISTMWKLRHLRFENVFCLDPTASALASGPLVCDNLEIDRVTIINDPASSAAHDCGVKIPNSGAGNAFIGNVTITNSIARTIAVGMAGSGGATGDATVTGCLTHNAVILNNSGSKTASGNAITNLTTLAGQQAVFVDPYQAPGSSTHGPVTDGPSTLAECVAHYGPLASGPADRGDGTFIGSFWPGGWAPTGVKATSYALSASAYSIPQGESIVLTATLKRDAVDAKWSTDVVLLVDFIDSTTGQTGTAEIVIPWDQSNGSVAITENGLSSGDLVITGHNAVGLADDELTILVGDDGLLEPQGTVHVNAVTPPGLAIGVELAPEETVHDVASSSPALASASAFSPGDTYHPLIDVAPSIEVAADLQPAGSAHAHVAGSTSLAAEVELHPSLTCHAPAAGSPVLSLVPSIVPPDILPAGTVRARAGETLDALIWREAGLGAVELSAVLEANPGLADYGPALPAGTLVRIPTTTPDAGERTLVQLWD